MPEALELANKAVEALRFCLLARGVNGFPAVPHGRALGFALGRLGRPVYKTGAHIDQQSRGGGADEGLFVRQKAQGNGRQRAQRRALDVEAGVQRVDQQQVGFQASSAKAQVAQGVEFLRQNQARHGRDSAELVLAGQSL